MLANVTRFPVDHCHSSFESFPLIIIRREQGSKVEENGSQKSHLLLQSSFSRMLFIKFDRCPRKHSSGIYDLARTSFILFMKYIILVHCECTSCTIESQESVEDYYNSSKPCRLPSLSRSRQCGRNLGSFEFTLLNDK